MKPKHIRLWTNICLEIAKVSNCPRGKFGALIVDEGSNTLIASGYNGYLRGGPPLCGGEELCRREAEKIVSGTNIEVGCVHAEMNAIINCAREGVSTRDRVMFISGEPCVMCAKFIVQAGLKKVFVIGGRYKNNGVHVLDENGVPVVDVKQGGKA